MFATQHGHRHSGRAAQLRAEFLEPRLLLARDVDARANLKLNQFEADAQYADIRGQSQSIVIMGFGLALNSPWFGPDNKINSTGAPGSDGISDRIVYSWNYTSNPPSSTTTASVVFHEAEVGSVAAGFQQGIFSGAAPNVNVISLQVFPDSATPGGISNYFDEIKAALGWVAANAGAYNIVAVNMAFSDTNRYTSAGPASNPNFDIEEELDDLVNNKGVIPIATTGNRFGCFDSQLGIGYPAADPNALAVGASWDVTRHFGGDYESFGDGCSNPQTWWVRQFQAHEDTVAPLTSRHPVLLDILAPGVQIDVGRPNGAIANTGGTSVAAPYVTGAVALAQQLAVRERGTKLTFSEFRNLIQSTGAVVHDNSYPAEDFSVNGSNPFNSSLPVPSGYDYKRLDINAMANQLVAPKVSAVKIGSNSGSVGHADYAVPVGNGDQLKTVPVGSPNEILITFTEAVDVVKGDLTVVGADSGTIYSVGTSTFNYNSTTKTAKWTFANAFPADQLVITLDDGVTDTAATANALDGEWSNPASLSTGSSDVFPSGNGTPGGDFIFRVTILPGDVDRNNIVNITDLNTTVNNSGLTPAIWTQGEMTGDNLVNLTDKNLVSNNFARNYTTWPGGGMMMMSGSGGGEIGEEAMREALLDYYFARLANPKAEDPYAGLLGSSVLGDETWWDKLLGEDWEQVL